MTELAPLAVWESNDHSNIFWRHWPESSEWAIAHLQDANSTYRVEFYLVDAPFAIVSRYLRGEGGKVRLVNGELPTETVTQLLDELPPPHLLAR